MERKRRIVLKDKQKFMGVIPAFYACYEDDGRVSPARTQALCGYLMEKGVKGVYVCGSSGECIYQSVEERMTILENVMEVARGRLTVIAHVAANSIEDSRRLAAHAQRQGVDAIAAIPPVYFKLPEHAIAQYWNAISDAAPDTEFIIYNIPQLAGVALTSSLLREMLKNRNVVGVKNSSMPVLDIQNWKMIGGDDFIVFNGPDEQYLGGRVMGAEGGIGGTYGAMPELYVKLEELIRVRDLETALRLQMRINELIALMCSCHGNMYAVIKEILKARGVNAGTARPPLAQLIPEDGPKVRRCIEEIDRAVEEFVR